MESSKSFLHTGMLVIIRSFKICKKKTCDNYGDTCVGKKRARENLPNVQLLPSKLMRSLLYIITFATLEEMQTRKSDTRPIIFCAFTPNNHFFAHSARKRSLTSNQVT